MKHPLEKPDWKSASPLMICEYFIEKFEAVPELLWTTGVYYTEEGRHCALGHCNYHLQPVNFESDALVTLFKSVGLYVTSVNDGCEITYSQSNPRARILAALNDIRTKLLSDQPKPEKEEKVRTVYVTVDEKVRELQEQTLNCN